MSILFSARFLWCQILPVTPNKKISTLHSNSQRTIVFYSIIFQPTSCEHSENNHKTSVRFRYKLTYSLPSVNFLTSKNIDEQNYLGEYEWIKN